MTRREDAVRAFVLIVLAIVAVDIVIPPGFGPLALGEIFEPYLAVAAILAGFAVFRTLAFWSRGLVIVLLAVALARYGPSWVSFPPQPAAQPLRIATWNVLAGDLGRERALRGIAASDADLIGLQELTPDVGRALDADATDFDHRVLPMHPGDPDVGLLSRYPVLESVYSREPAVLRAVVQLPAAPTVAYVIHPPLGRFETFAGIPVSVNIAVRDAALAIIRTRIDEDLAAGRSVIVMGDFNATEREPAFGQLAAGLRDAHLDAGTGPGFTWRPAPMSRLPFGLLRIDYVLSTPDFITTSSTVDCTLPSDHCRLDVGLTAR